MSSYEELSSHAVFPRQSHDWIIGLSGGVDSVVLLDMCHKFNLEQGQQFNLIPVHLNHMTRAEESDKDMQLCEELANNYHLNLIKKLSNVPLIVDSSCQNFEDTARRERHKLFYEVASTHDLKSPVVLLAHHENDQIETIMMRLLRDASWRGLRGIEQETTLPVNPQYIQQKLRVSRPLLTITKLEILNYANSNNLKWREDKSNNDQSYDRNQLRHTVIPILKIIKPDFSKELLKLADRATQVERRIQQAASSIEHTNTPSELSINCTSAYNATHAAFVRLIETLCQNIHSQLLLPKRAYASLQDLHNKKIKATDISEDIHIYKHQNKFYLYKKNTPLPAINYSHYPDGFKFENNYSKLEITRTVLNKKIPHKDDPNVEYIPLTFHNTLLKISLPAGEELLKTFGSNSARKIGKILKNKNIPPHKRKQIPLLYAENHPLWIVGVALNIKYKLNNPTGEVFCLQYSLK